MSIILIWTVNVILDDMHAKIGPAQFKSTHSNNIYALAQFNIILPIYYYLIDRSRVSMVIKSTCFLIFYNYQFGLCV